jgi:hypothetical protein
MINMFFCLFITSCNNYGYIYDLETQKPVKNVLVEDLENKLNITFTDDEGMFEFKNCGDLKINKNGYVIDTLNKFGCKPNGKCFNGHIFYMIKTSSNAKQEK